MVNAAVELASRDPQVTHQVETSRRTMGTVLTSALTRAKASGELPGDRDPQALAGLLLVLLRGMRGVARAAPESRFLPSAVSQALELLA